MSPTMRFDLLSRQDSASDGSLYENRGNFALSRSTTMLTLATICVALRFLCRKIASSKYARDDWMLLVALFVVFGAGAANLAEVANGLGRHASTLTFEMRARFFMSLYIMEWWYVTSVATTKFALLLLYLRVFAVSNKFRVSVYLVATSIALWAMALYLVLAFQCNPIHAAWMPWVKAKCLSIKWIQVGNAVPNMLTDIIILSLPLTQISKLRVDLAKRLSLCVTFLLGGFVTIASAVRLYILVTQMDLNDATWSFLEPCVWCVIELTSGVISVCLPTFWPLLVRISHTYYKYISSRSASRLSSSAGHQSGREVITIGGGKARFGRGTDDDYEISMDMRKLTREGSEVRKSGTESYDDRSADGEVESYALHNQL